ncbi:pentapeptide repeat-containing protein [Streptomyces sp. NPDC059009]|uniref:pentapeptide repeat-containing protein n=1 Tax=Streptomyces sp. NPDC059009 TaxID=3346694 RepID=UPI0036BAFC83
MVEPYRACLAHLAAQQVSDYFATLSAGSDIDHRGTRFTADLLTRLIRSLRDETAGDPRVGAASFDGAVFTETAGFTGVRFTGTASFEGSTFHAEADFTDATFQAAAYFGRAKFIDSCDFAGATFVRYAGFSGAEFGGEDANFYWTTFHRAAGFVSATFSARLDLGHAWFYSDLLMRKAEFATPQVVGPLVCAQAVDLRGATFRDQTLLALCATYVNCQDTRWDAPCSLRLRYATVSLSMASITAPFALGRQRRPFKVWGHDVREDPIRGATDDVTVRGVGSVDASLLRLMNVDLSECLFSAAFNLDQIRIEGACRFASTPPGWVWRHGFIPFHWTRRQTIAEEATVRRSVHHGHRPGGRRITAQESRRRDFALAAAIYRHLRKALEDAKDEPGAADFYYGEMEMRRHSRKWSEAERWLLQAYWLLSGYGLRASRALGWLTLAMTTTVALMMGFGLPQDSPRQAATGTVPSGGGKVTFVIDEDDPKNPSGDRFTTQRFEKALKVTLNSVVFRSSGQNLTTAGDYIEMGSRFTEPILLGLGALAIRGRVKR